MFDISFVQFESTIASVPAPTTWRAACSEVVAASASDKRKQETINSATLFSEPTRILDGSAPSCRTAVGRVEHRTASISCVKKTVLLL